VNVGEPETVIRVENLGKRYVIRHAGESGPYRTLRDTLARGARTLGRRLLGRGGDRPGPAREEFWALKDVSFEVKRGEVLGVIGRNGAGKSTLLKILSRITEPTTGRVEIDGRVASLLEVGTGFHPELTGRENVYLNGSILGMSRAEIRRKFDEIVAFAEVEKFLDTPVKRYSSGMYLRLAFAVAAHLEPEILIVDEVLAVGDAEFQKKCIGMMGEVARGGRTVLFVSHNMGAVQALCGRVVILQAGRLIGSGPAAEIVTQHLRTSDSGQTFVRAGGSDSMVSLRSASIGVVTGKGNRTILEVTACVLATAKCTVSIDLRVEDAVGMPVGFAPVGSFNHAQAVKMGPGLTRVRSEHDISALAGGNYTLSIDIADPAIAYYDRVHQCLSFEVHSPPRDGCYRRLHQAWGLGTVELPYLTHTAERLEDEGSTKAAGASDIGDGSSGRDRGPEPHRVRLAQKDV
jgi:lipopolysaccharide transport system ATP-binding protein